MQSNRSRHHVGLEEMVTAIKTGVDSVAVVVSVCCDSDYNLPAICFICRTQNRRQNRV